MACRRFLRKIRSVAVASCYYCDRIQQRDPAYIATAAEYDLGSGAPRCWRHWRYVCGHCHQPAHFMATAYCTQQKQFFCSSCATATEEVAEPFWAWDYFFRYRSPWSGQWEWALDRLEFEGTHPLQRGRPKGTSRSAISPEPYLARYPETYLQRRVESLTDEDVRESWDNNAERWTANYDDDGDRNRRFQSDEPMLDLLGDVKGLRVLDAGCGNGYLSRKLAKSGATMVAVEQSERFLAIARRHETDELLGIAFHDASLASMPFLPDNAIDKAIANYVLMDVREYEKAVAEIFRVLKPGGVFVCVISHPCFSCGNEGWHKPALDSPRMEDRLAKMVDLYFHRGPLVGQWGNLLPVTGFHRPLRDYWQTFIGAGFRVEGFEEPSITERGRRELPPSRVRHALRIPFSCIFKLVKP